MLEGDTVSVLLLKNEDKRYNIAKAGHKYIQQFNWDGVVNKLENILQNV